MSKTYWAILTERHGVGYKESFDSLADIIEYTGRLKDFHRMVGPTLEPAHARNAACQTFYYNTPKPDPNDTLVMLDVDHVMQHDLVQRLAAHTPEKGVVGALATARGAMPFACFFKRMPEGNVNNITAWEEGEIVEGTITGSGAIAIKRWVLEKLKHCAPSWFRYGYGQYMFEATEEMYFGYECEKAGISHWCDTNLWIPHCTVNYTTPQDWLDYVQDHPEIAKVTLPEPKPIITGGDDTWGQKIAATIKRTL
jgi:hypothetical protein